MVIWGWDMSDKQQKFILLYITIALIALAITSGIYGLYDYHDTHINLQIISKSVLACFSNIDNPIKCLSYNDSYKVLIPKGQHINNYLVYSKEFGALATYSTIFTILIKFFPEFAANLSLLFSNKYIAIIGDDDFSKALANKVAEQKKCLLFSKDNKEIGKKGKLITLPFLELKKGNDSFKPLNKARKIIINAKSDAEALPMAKQAKELFPNSEHIIRISDIWKARNIESIQEGVRSFSIAEAGAYEVVRRHLPFLLAEDLGQSQIHIMLIGDDDYVEALMNEIAISSITIKYGAPSFSLYVNDDIAFKEKILARYPEIEKDIKLKFHKISDISHFNITKNGFADIAQFSAITAIYCAFENSEKSLETSMQIQAEAKKDDNQTFPIFARIENGDSLESKKAGEKLEKNEIVPFGSLKNICDASEIISDKSDALAKWYHEIYMETPSAKKNTVDEWKDLNESGRNSNRRAIKHIYAKLFDANINIRNWLKKEKWDELPKLKNGKKFIESQEMRDELAKLEHDRWNIVTRLDGFSFGMGADGKKDRNKKLHPCLVEFAALDPEVAKFDYEMLEGIRKALEETKEKGLIAKIKNFFAKQKDKQI